MSRSQIARWEDRLKRVEDVMWGWYHYSRVDLCNEPAKLAILDKWGSYTPPVTQ